MAERAIEAGYSRATLRDYRLHVERYEREGNGDPEAWLDSLTPAMARNGRSALRWAYPDLELRRRRVEQIVPRALSHEQLEAVREAADPRTRQSIDWLYYTGARVSEFLRLRPEHVRDGLVLLPERKKRIVERPVPMHPSLDPSVLPWPVKRDQVTRDLRETGARSGSGCTRTSSGRRSPRISSSGGPTPSPSRG